MRALHRQRPLLWLAGFTLVFLLALSIAPLIGGESLGLRALLDRSSVEGFILREQRLPRVFLGLLVGGGLALAGACLQAVLRNPLAEPYTLGLSGGAAVGAALVLTAPGLGASLGGLAAVQAAALLGAGAALVFVYLVARRPMGIHTATVLLAGVTVSVLASGVIMLVRIVVRPDEIAHVDRWMMGGLVVVGYRDVITALPLLTIGASLLMSTMRELNQLALGEELAGAQGVDVATVQRRVLLGAGLVTAAVVAAAGPIGFVGLLIPHAVRRLAGHDHRVLLPGAFLMGGAVLVICDTLARTLVYPTEIPVGVITAVVGGPLFIMLLLRMR